MKLQQLIIKNFRGLKGDENIIDFSTSNIIFLIGQNNVGKSTILKAYEFFVSSSQVATTSDFSDYSPSEAIEIEGIFIKEIEDENDTELSGTGKGADPQWMAKWVDDNNLVKIKKRWTAAGKGEKYTFSPVTEEYILNGFGGLETIFQKYAPSPIFISAMETEASLEKKVNDLLQKEILKKLKDEYGVEYNNLLAGIKELQEKITGSEIVEKYNSEINENFRKVFDQLILRITPKDEDNIKIEDSFKANHSVSILREGFESSEIFTNYGHGVIRQALYNFITFINKLNDGTKKKYLILYEEPELFLHPEVAFKLRSSLYELAENSPFQIICATHSPLMIDLSKPHSSLVRIEKNKEGVTSLYQVGDEVFRSDNEAKQRLQMINRFNPHVCESFYAKTVIIVEGDTEAMVFRDLINRHYNTYEIYVLNSGTKNNIPFFQEIFTAFNIEHYVIHDTDQRKNNANENENSAWTLNGKIWDKILKANEKRAGLARRYVHVSNFETAHGIVLTGKDKPINAFNYAKELLIDSDAPCMTLLRDIIFDRALLHDNNYVEALFPPN